MVGAQGQDQLTYVGIFKSLKFENRYPARFANLSTGLRFFWYSLQRKMIQYLFCANARMMFLKPETGRLDHKMSAPPRIWPVKRSLLNSKFNSSIVSPLCLYWIKCPVFIADVPEGCSRVGDPNYPDYVNCTNSQKVRNSPAGFGEDLGGRGGGGGGDGILILLLFYSNPVSQTFVITIPRLWRFIPNRTSVLVCFAGSGQSRISLTFPKNRT